MAQNLSYRFKNFENFNQIPEILQKFENSGVQNFRCGRPSVKIKSKQFECNHNLE